MKKNFLVLVLGLAALAAPAFAYTDIGVLKIAGNSNVLPVRVWGNTAALNGLANEAFQSHGRYHVVSSGYAYDIRFTQVGAAAVHVDVARGVGGGSVLSQTVAGDNANDALLHAADLAVERTNGLGLKGYFSSKIAFICEYSGHKEVYTSDLFFANGARQLTHDGAIALEPRWSPDGAKIIYTSFYHSGFPDIFLVDLATNVRTTFASYRGTNSGAHFSPDGGRVAMVLSADGNSEIYVSNAQGRGMVRKTHYESVKASPCWSPDGSRLVFASGQSNPQLYVVSAAGGAPSRLASGLSSYCAEPDWSRGAPNKIAFTIAAGRGNYQIAVYDFSKGQAEQVSKASFDGLNPSWLPDGRHLVYTARSAATSVLCILDTETGQSSRISPRSFGACEEANVWSR